MKAMLVTAMAAALAACGGGGSAVYVGDQASPMRPPTSIRAGATAAVLTALFTNGR